MTTLEQKQQAAFEAYENRVTNSTLSMKVAFVNGAEWAEAQVKWIPVNEGLPDVDAGNEYGYLRCWVVIKGSGYKKIMDFNCWEQEWDAGEGDGTVAFYMPLTLPPIPPAQEGGEQ